MAGSPKPGASMSVRKKCPGVYVCLYVRNLSEDYWEGGYIPIQHQEELTWKQIVMLAERV